MPYRDRPLIDLSQIDLLGKCIARDLAADNWPPDTIVGLANENFMMVTQLAKLLGVQCVVGMPVRTDDYGCRLDPLVSFIRGKVRGSRVLVVADLWTPVSPVNELAASLAAMESDVRIAAFVTMNATEQEQSAFRLHAGVPMTTTPDLACQTLFS